jgi:hypothetical protein
MMDRRAMRDKMATVTPPQDPRVVSEDPPVEPEQCPYCGQQVHPSRCRAVPAGWFCWAWGLQDSRVSNLVLMRQLQAVAVEQDKDVRKAQAELAKVQPQADAAEAEWSAAVMAHRSAAQRRMAVHSVMSGDYGELVDVAPQGTPSERDVQLLREMAAQASMQREFVLESVLKKRDQVERAKRRARARLAAAA